MYGKTLSKLEESKTHAPSCCRPASSSPPAPLLHPPSEGPKTQGPGGPQTGGGGGGGPVLSASYRLWRRAGEDCGGGQECSGPFILCGCSGTYLPRLIDCLGTRRPGVSRGELQIGTQRVPSVQDGDGENKRGLLRIHDQGSGGLGGTKNFLLGSVFPVPGGVSQNLSLGGMGGLKPILHKFSACWDGFLPGWGGIPPLPHPCAICACMLCNAWRT